MMRITAAILTLLMLSSVSCGYLVKDAYDDKEFGYDPGEGPEPGMTPSRIKARIISDVRGKRKLAADPEKGEKDVPGIDFSKGDPRCRAHKDPLFVIDFAIRNESGRFAIRERAYYCRVEREYWYRWKKVSSGDERWFGPFPSHLRGADE